MENKKAEHFTIDTIGYKLMLDLYTEPNKGGNLSRFGFKGFKNGRVLLVGTHNISVKTYINLNNAIKAGIKLSKLFENCEITICGVDYRGFTTECVYLSDII